VITVVRFFEKRIVPRNPYKAPLSVQELNDIYIYRARMVNYSDKGMYIETDIAFEKGTDLIIGIEDSTFISHLASVKKTPEFYRVKILWQKNLIGSIFNFGYGVKIISIAEEQKALDANFIIRPELRKHPRKIYPKPVIFTSKNRYCRGWIINISRGGVFIKTKEKFSAGQIIKLIIPGTKIDKGIKLKGEVLHFNPLGAGIVFKRIIRKQVDNKFSTNQML